MNEALLILSLMHREGETQEQEKHQSLKAIYDKAGGIVTQKEKGEDFSGHA